MKHIGSVLIKFLSFHANQRPSIDMKTLLSAYTMKEKKKFRRTGFQRLTESNYQFTRKKAASCPN